MLPWLFYGDQESVRAKGFKTLQFSAFQPVSPLRVVWILETNSV